MKIDSATFLISAPDLKSCPPHHLPELAFIGRSNVGKSSMINLLTGRKDLAKVSATPGFTKLINFFVINRTWSLVDLPGYGYAKVAQRHRTEFNQAVADYLARRENLRLSFVLIDSRIPPQKMDLEFLRWLSDGGIPFTIIFTKIDKLSSTALQASIGTFLSAMSEAGMIRPEFLTSSSKLRKGRNEILRFIANRLAAADPL